MPFTKKKAAPKRKMIRRKQWARRPKRVIVNTALNPIPQRYIAKMKYSETVTSDAQGRVRFNLNSLWDPNAEVGGHQPYGFDTLASLYNRYRVISCGYRITTTSTTGSVGQSFQVAALPANESLTILSMSEVKENPRAKYIIQTAGGGSAVLSGKTYIPSLVGRTKYQYMADDRYQALVTTSPNEFAILNIFTSGTGSDVPSSLSVNVLLEYTVEFFDIKHLAQS